MLNLFGYTGGATLACAAAGASVCHVDASKGIVAWARENAAESRLADKPIRWIVDDCTKFVAREARRGSRYDAIIMDPPSYGRGPGGEVWKLSLIHICLAVVDVGDDGNVAQICTFHLRTPSFLPNGRVRGRGLIYYFYNAQ